MGSSVTDELAITDELDISDEFDSHNTSANEDYESDEPPKLKLDLQELKQCASTIASATCIRARRLTRGGYHEIFLLEFGVGPETLVEIKRARNSCIARLTRSEESLAKATSELATMRHGRDHTSIPVAKIFHQDLRPDNPVGAPFVLMERLPGKHLYKLWDDLSLDHKKDVLTQIASVLARLAVLHFGGIGSVQDNGLGPLVHPSLHSQEEKPFKSTLEYLHALIPDIAVDLDEYAELVEIRQHLSAYLSSKSETSCYGPPFRLIHDDLDAQNLLFVKQQDCQKPPILSGVIDFEYAYTGPLYYLHEYPIFIQDVDFSPELYEQNAILRPHFVRALRQSFPKDSADAISARDIMREKNYLLNSFPGIMEVIKSNDPPQVKRNCLLCFLEGWRDGTGPAYNGRRDYVPDPELESDQD